MFIFEKIAEDRIQEAMRNGEFDNLPSKGKPISLDYWLSLPPDIRAGLMVLKNSGFVPEEVQLLNEIEDLREKLAACSDEAEQKALRKALEETRLKYNLINEYKKLKKRP